MYKRMQVVCCQCIDPGRKRAGGAVLKPTCKVGADGLGPAQCVCYSPCRKPVISHYTIARGNITGLEQGESPATHGFRDAMQLITECMGTAAVVVCFRAVQAIVLTRDASLITLSLNCFMPTNSGLGSCPAAVYHGMAISCLCAMTSAGAVPDNGEAGAAARQRVGAP